MVACDKWDRLHALGSPDQVNPANFREIAEKVIGNLVRVGRFELTKRKLNRRTLPFPLTLHPSKNVGI
jgi:hypothetical protein